MNSFLSCFYLQDPATSPVIPAMHARCSSTGLVSRVTALISTVARVSALVSTVAGVTTALAASTLVLLVVVVRGILLRVVLHLLTVVEVFALGLDEFVGFSAREAGDEVFGKCMVFSDTLVGIEGFSNLQSDQSSGRLGREMKRGNAKAGWGSLPLACSCCWYFLTASKPAAPAMTSCVKLPWLSG